MKGLFKGLLCSVGWAVALLLLYSAQAGAEGTGTGIATPGSPHNFADDYKAGLLVAGSEIGTTGWNKREEICRACHVPHDHNRSQNYGANGLLWNRQVSNATYVMYSSSSLNGSIASAPTGIAKMCLGCHDGTVAIDTFDKYTGVTVFMNNYDADFQVPGPLYTGDLSKTHPISITYDENADNGLNPKSTPMGTSGTIADVLQNGNTVQCSSCHDIHDQAGEAVPGTHLLRAAQTVATGGTASGLCLTCHKK